jgi:hypothetical protein
VDDSHSHLTAVRLLRMVRLASLVIAAVALFVFDLPPLLATLHTFTLPWVAAAGFLVLTGILATEAILIARSRSWGKARWPSAGLVLATSAFAGAVIPGPEVFGYANWLFDSIGWFAVILLFDQPLPFLAGFLALHFAGIWLHVLLRTDRNLAAVMGLATNTVSIGAMQLALGGAAIVLRRSAAIAVLSADAHEEAHRKEAIAVRIHQDRQHRYAELVAQVRPLLAGLADGTLDPAAETIRQRCAIAAARMRRLFAENDDVENKLLHELRACSDVAERRGVLVQLAAQGTWPALPPSVRRRLTEPALSALSTAQSWARVTITGSQSGVSVSVVADCEVPPVPASGNSSVEVATVCDEDRLWVRATWQPGR